VVEVRGAGGEYGKKVECGERVGLEEDRRTVRELVLRKTGGRLECWS
jgi:hypothetical protein